MTEFSSTKKLRQLKSNLYQVSSGSITAIVRALNETTAEMSFVSNFAGKGHLDKRVVKVILLQDREGVIFFNDSRDY